MYYSFTYPAGQQFLESFYFPLNYSLLSNKLFSKAPGIKQLTFYDFFLFLAIAFDLTRSFFFICRFLLPHQLVSFHLSASRRNSAGLLQPWLLILVGGFRLGFATGCGNDSLCSRTIYCARHPTRLRKGCRGVAG